MMYRKLSWRSISVLSLGGALVSLASACGDDASPAGGASVPDASPPDRATPDATSPDASAAANPELEAFCDRTLGLYAPRYVECCEAQSGAASKRYSFDKQLLEGTRLACTMTLGKSLTMGRVTFDPAASAACETNAGSAIRARTCPEVLHPPSNQPLRSIFRDAEGCAGVLVGHQVADAPCANDYDCTDGLTCVGWTPTSDGVCKAPPGEGALCGYGIPDGGGFLELFRWGFGIHPRCAAGFYCAATALQQGTCRATKPATGSCDSHDECADGLRCQLGVCGTAGPAPAGEACHRNSDCQGGLYCKRGDGGSVCAPRELAGTACDNELGSECEGACVKPDGGGAASCVAFCGSR